MLHHVKKLKSDIPFVRSGVICIDLNFERHYDDCNMCGKYRFLNHAVAWYCGPTHDEIGSITTEYTDGGEVGGMLVCKECHDDWYRKELENEQEG